LRIITTKDGFLVTHRKGRKKCMQMIKPTIITFSIEKKVVACLHAALQSWDQEVTI